MGQKPYWKAAAVVLKLVWKPISKHRNFAESRQ
jgi:hypothetical protein